MNEMPFSFDIVVMCSVRSLKQLIFPLGNSVIIVLQYSFSVIYLPINLKYNFTN